VNPRSKVIVTGVQGQDGSILCEILVNLGYEVIGIGRRRLDDFSARDVSLRKLSELNTHSGSFKYAICDLRDSTSVHNLINTIKPQTVFNLAAQMNVRRSVAEPTFDASINVVGFVNVLESARLSGVKKVVFSSGRKRIFLS
jgi:UDP-glucose 4-epimerase